MKVIVTRPLAEAQTWVAQLQAKGLEAIALPLIEINAAKNSQVVVDAVAVARDNASQYAAIMFVSSNAVRHFHMKNQAVAGVNIAYNAINNIALSDQSNETPRYWATGPGTAKALLAAGIAAHLIDAPANDAAQFDSEALWERVRGQVKAGDRVLIVRGTTQQSSADNETLMNGRPWLADQLTGVGVQVDTVVSYERRAPVFTAEQMAWIEKSSYDGSVWLFSSSEAIDNLHNAAKLIDWSKSKAIATHPRIAQAAKRVGFGVVCESRPLLSDVVTSIESLV